MYVLGSGWTGVLSILDAADTKPGEEAGRGVARHRAMAAEVIPELRYWESGIPAKALGECIEAHSSSSRYTYTPGTLGTR